MTGKTIAAIDLGSNSFHLIIAQLNDEGLSIVQRERQSIQLASFLDEELNLSAAGFERAQRCLTQFLKIIADYQPIVTRIVATNTVRVAKNQQAFLKQMKTQLSLDIDVINGLEEARLIYRGAMQASRCELAHLVVDIGGGSTELILGQGSKIQSLVSLPFGCVNMTQQFIANYPDWQEAKERLTLTLQSQLLPVREDFPKEAWQQCQGCSGTVQTILDVLSAHGEEEAVITAAGLNKLQALLERSPALEELRGLRQDRKNVFVAGVHIMTVLFDILAIDRMTRSNGALREGVLLELSESARHLR